MENPKKAFIFDFDGTLVDTEPAHKKAVFDIFEKFKLPVQEKDLFDAIGNPDPIFFRKMIQKYLNQSNEEMVQEMLIEKRKIYRKIVMDFPIITNETIQFLKSIRNFPKAIATTSSKETVDIILGNLKLNHYFETIIGCFEVKNLKPNPEPFLLAAKSLNLYPQECIAVEDSPPGTKSAIDAGCYTVGMLGLFSKEQLPNCHEYINGMKDWEHLRKNLIDKGHLLVNSQ